MAKLVINSSSLKGVPFNEYYLEDEAYKGLVFVQHGYKSNKDYGADYLAVPLARLGYFVVSIDAYMHGERIKEPFISGSEEAIMTSVPQVIRRTSIDIMKLHKIKYEKTYPKFDFIGISMGGMMAYYIATKSKRIRKLAPIIGTPDYVNQAYYGLKVAGFDIEKIMSNDTLKYLKKMNPSDHIHKMNFEEALILCGKNDKQVPYLQNELIFKAFKEKTKYIVYEENHQVNRTMQREIFQFIQS